ncbi:hypothetical protein OROHE_021575 [Orobanche hederae]
MHSKSYLQLLRERWNCKEGALGRQYHSAGFGGISTNGRKNSDDLLCVNYTADYSQLSTSSTMPRNLIPTRVYQRRRQTNGIKPQKNVVSIAVDQVLNDFNSNDNCSSSKSNLELSSASLKSNTDDAGECSSSGGALIDNKETSARDICISILRSQGLLGRISTGLHRASTEKNNKKLKYCSKPCRGCERMESTSNMLVCDNCERAFHVSCYNPHITVLPVGEWICGSCLKKKHKILKDKLSGNSIGISSEIGRNRCSEGELGSLEYMFRDTEPYMSNVRIGDEFQANVPDWSGPVDKECCDGIGDPLKINPSDVVNMQERDSIRPLKLSSIGNWLQCREVIEGIGEGVDGTVCAKWRRAPLFEVQTDNWDCFHCVLWDPAHADCAVPQELDTEQVMKQLKYIEMLRPQLAAKRRKMDCSQDP